MNRRALLRQFVVLLLTLGPIASAARVPSIAQSPSVLSGDWVQTTAAEFATGQAWNVAVIDLAGGELRLSPGAEAGIYTSTIAAADWEFTAIAPLWRAQVPPGSMLQVALRTRLADGYWSDWHVFDDVEWHSSQQRFYPVAPLLIAGGRQFQYRITMAAAPPELKDGSTPVQNADRSPILYEMDIAYLDATSGPTTSEAKSLSAAAQPVPHRVPPPPIISRAAWGADESYMTWEPEYRPVCKIVVHHTVTPNDYTEGQAASWVRAIYYYHAVTLGWGDVGYNYLVDRYGNVYEGHYGGPGVVGGHVYGYNYGSAGIAVLGTHGNSSGSVPPTSPSLASLADLSAWEANRSYIHPLESEPWGAAVMPNLAGHRDYPPYATTCPGDDLYAALPGLRQSVWDRLISYTQPYEVEWLTWQTPPPVLHTGWTYSLPIRVRNAGWLTWSVGSPNPVHIGYHWLDSNGQPVVQPPADDHRGPLASDLPFGHVDDLAPAWVTTPITPGTYTLAWDMVREGITWFHDANASSPLLTMTITNTVPRYLSGYLRDPSGHPVPRAEVVVPDWMTASADDAGAYSVPLPGPGTYTVTARADGYTSPLPAYGIDATQSDTTHSFVLVPDDWVEAVTNGDLEDELTNWDTGAISASLPGPTATSHTGLSAAQLGPSTITGTAWLSQSVVLSGIPVSRTLSFLYRVPATDGHASVQVAVTDSASSAIVYTLPVTVTGWTHFHVELPAHLSGPVELRLALVQEKSLVPTIALLDEVRLGYRRPRVYLPLVLKDR